MVTACSVRLSRQSWGAICDKLLQGSRYVCGVLTERVSDPTRAVPLDITECVLVGLPLADLAGVLS